MWVPSLLTALLLNLTFVFVNIVIVGRQRNAS
jgi:hypothetical protein